MCDNDSSVAGDKIPTDGGCLFDDDQSLKKNGESKLDKMRSIKNTMASVKHQELPDQFVVLLGDKLRIYSEKPAQIEDSNPDHLFVINRKEGPTETNDDEMSFSLSLQDSKVRSKLK